MTASPPRPKKTGPDRIPCPNCSADLKVSHSRTFSDRVRLRRHACSACPFVELSVQVPIAAEGIISFAGKRLAIAENITIVVPKTPSAEEHQPTRTHPGFRRCEKCDALLSLRTRGELCRACFDVKRADSAGVSVCASCGHASSGTCSFGYPEAFTREADDCFMHYDGVIE
jgi:hypothetical protein